MTQTADVHPDKTLAIKQTTPTALAQKISCALVLLPLPVNPTGVASLGVELWAELEVSASVAALLVLKIADSSGVSVSEAPNSTVDVPDVPTTKVAIMLVVSTPDGPVIMVAIVVVYDSALDVLSIVTGSNSLSGKLTEAEVTSCVSWPGEETGCSGGISVVVIDGSDSSGEGLSAGEDDGLAVTIGTTTEGAFGAVVGPA